MLASLECVQKRAGYLCLSPAVTDLSQRGGEGLVDPVELGLCVNSKGGSSGGFHVVGWSYVN